MKKTIFITLLGLSCLGMQAQSISLAGEWDVVLGESQSGFVKGKTALSSTANVKHAVLPGTIDTNHLGQAPTDLTETTHLTRISSYKGAARYSRTIEIPQDWKKKPVMLFLERTKPTWVYLDGQLVDSCNFISTPQRYILPQKLKSGKHLLEIVVDNSKGVPEQIYASSHAYTEDTQTNWNGIIGDIRLEVKSYPSEVKSEEGRVKNSTALQGAIPSEDVKFMGEALPCFKDFHIEGAHFYANGHKVFLRGKHDAAVGGMDEVSWHLQGIRHQPCSFPLLVSTRSCVCCS